MLLCIKGLHFTNSSEFIAPSRPTKKRGKNLSSCPRLTQDPAEKETTLELAIYELEPHCALTRPKHLISWHGSAFDATYVPPLREFNDGNNWVELPRGQISPPCKYRLRFKSALFQIILPFTAFRLFAGFFHCKVDPSAAKVLDSAGISSNLSVPGATQESGVQNLWCPPLHCLEVVVFSIASFFIPCPAG